MRERGRGRNNIYIYICINELSAGSQVHSQPQWVRKPRTGAAARCWRGSHPPSGVFEVVHGTDHGSNKASKKTKLKKNRDTHTHIYIYIYISKSVYIYIHMFVYMYLFTYIYKYKLYIYIYIYIWSPPPPYDRPRNCFSSLSRKGVEDQHSKIPRVSTNPKIQKLQPKFRIFGNSSGSLKIQKPSSRSSFQKSKNPKNPPQGLDFWKLEREPQNPKIQIPRVSKNPKIQKFKPKFRIFGNSSGSLKIQNSCSRSSFQKSKPWGGFFGFLDFRKLERELDSWILRLPLEFPKNKTLGWIFWNPNWFLCYLRCCGWFCWC